MSFGCPRLVKAGLAYDCHSLSMQDLRIDPSPSKALYLADMPRDELAAVEEVAKSPCLPLHIEQLHMAQVRALLSSNLAAGTDLVMAVARVVVSAGMPSHRDMWTAKANAIEMEQGKERRNQAVEKASGTQRILLLELEKRDMPVQALAPALGFEAVVMGHVWEADLVFWVQYFGSPHQALSSLQSHLVPGRSSCSNMVGTCSYPSSPFLHLPPEFLPSQGCSHCPACLHLRTPDMASEKWPCS